MIIFVLRYIFNNMKQKLDNKHIVNNCYTFISQWENGLAELFKEVVAQVAVNYCEQENCYHSKVNKR